MKATSISELAFKKKIEKYTTLGNVDFWCVFEKQSHKAVAFAINTCYSDCCNYNTMKANPAYLKNSTYPYYGLIYEMNRYYLDELKLKYVNDGARSITEHSNIQPFLIEKFNFRKAYCKLQIEYQWWMKLGVNVLYPFRNIIPVRTVKAILNMEAMKRGEY